MDGLSGSNNLGQRMFRISLIAVAAIGAILASTLHSRAQADICARMQGRLDRLTNDVSIDDYEFNLRRDRIEAALDANNCPVSDYQYRDLPLLDEVEPGSREVLGGQSDPVEPGMNLAPTYGGQFQTLCVRTCDGYYFPLTYETGAENFQRDQAQCQAQCPGAELFYKNTGDEKPESMISLSGQAYKDMPNAFKFRKAGANATPQCTCQKTAGNYSTMGDPRQLAKGTPEPSAAAKPIEPAKQLPAIEPAKPEQPARAKIEPSPSVIKPAEPAKQAIIEPAKPAPANAEPIAPAAAKPATEPSSIIQLGEPVPAKTKAPLPQPLSEDKPIDPNRKVRVVGPTFLPDQAGAANPPAPVQKSNQ